MSGIDGVYSIVVSSVALSSIGVIEVIKGRVRGNDNLGSIFAGSAELNPYRNTVGVDLIMSTPPDSYQVKSGSIEGQFELRSIAFAIPAKNMGGGIHHENDSHGITLIFRKLPGDYAPLAGQNGRWLQIRTLNAANRAWNVRCAELGLGEV